MTLYLTYLSGKDGPITVILSSKYRDSLKMQIAILFSDAFVTINKTDNKKSLPSK